MKLAVIQTGGKQYLVKPGDVIKIERLAKPEKQGEFLLRRNFKNSDARKGGRGNGSFPVEVTASGKRAPEGGSPMENIAPSEARPIFYFDKVLLIVDEENIKIGKPFLENVKVSAEWQKQERAKKITILRYHSKTRYKKKKGHRQIYTEVRIKEIIS